MMKTKLQQLRTLYLCIASAVLLLTATTVCAQDTTKTAIPDSSATVGSPKGPAGGRFSTPLEIRTGTIDFNSGGRGFAGGAMKVMASPLSTGPATLGATVGGAQDIGYARQLIESGLVPGAIQFSPEGLYSEHDIPTPSSECNSTLCLSLGYGFAPAADTKQNALFVHLGMGSNIRPEDFVRPHLQLAVVVDKSGSMQGPSMAAVKTALHKLIEQLGPEDELTLIEFNDAAKLILPPTRVSDRSAITQAIDQLTAQGGTNIEAGLKLGFEQLAALRARTWTSKRVMLFTDAMPNAGRTDSGSFRVLTERYAKEEIGLTAFGVGLQFGQELVYHISQLRGGNFFFLENSEKIAKVFDTEFDYLVTPVVYDLNVTIKTPEGMKLTDVYGLPTWEQGSHDAELKVPTVFFSSNRGAIVLRYEKEADDFAINNGDLLARGEIGYTEPSGRRYMNTTELRHVANQQLQPGMQFYTHDGMRTAVALTNIFFGLRDGCTLYAEGKKEDAVAAVKRAKALVQLENLAMLDSGIAEEIELLTKLTANIESAETLNPAAQQDNPEEIQVLRRSQP